MKIVTKAAVEGMLHSLYDDLVSEKVYYDYMQDILFYMKHLEEISWDDPDYYYDRKAQLVKKVDGKYINKNDLA